MGGTRGGCIVVARTYAKITGTTQERRGNAPTSPGMALSERTAEMRGHSTKSPKTFRILFPLDWPGIGPFQWLPFAPTYGRYHNDGRYHFNVHRCPYCAQWHQHVDEHGSDSESRLEQAPCSSFFGQDVDLCYRTIPIESPDGPPSVKELDEYFPLVDYALTNANDACFRIERDQQGFVITAERLHEDWLPHGPLYERYVFGHRIEAHAMAGVGVSGVRQPIPRELRAAVWQKTFGRCYLCGALPNPFDDLHIDHLQPVADGGTNDLSNLWPACATCNQQKHAMSLEAFRARRGGGLFWFEVARMGGGS